MFVAKRCLSLWIHGCLVKDQWNITRQRRFLQSPKHWRYNWWFCNYFQVKNLGKHHDLYVQSDTLLLPDVLKQLLECVLWNMWTCSCSLFCCIMFSMASSLVVNVEYVMLFIDKWKPIANAWKIMIKIKKSPYLKYWDINNLCECTMSQKMVLIGLKIHLNVIKIL